MVPLVEIWPLQNLKHSIFHRNSRRARRKLLALLWAIIFLEPPKICLVHLPHLPFLADLTEPFVLKLFDNRNSEKIAHSHENLTLSPIDLLNQP